MIIIGEKINSTLKAVRGAIESRNSSFVIDLAQKQYDAGCDYIDINAGELPSKEEEHLEWLVSTIQSSVDAPFSIGFRSPAALQKALEANKNGKPLVNYISEESTRYKSVLPLVLEYNTGIIALCIDDSGMPETADERLSIASKLINRLTSEGVKPGDIFIDPLVRPVASGSHYGTVAIDTFRRVKAEFPEVHLTCGISIISMGMPARKLMNQAFLVASTSAGLDSAIMDPLDKRLMSLVYASEVLLGIDNFCMNYNMKYREGMFDL